MVRAAPEGARQPAEPAQPAPATTKSASSFNPAISVILTGNYANLSQDPADYHIAGFMPPEEGVGPGDRSFNLGESEVTLSANIDPYFLGALTVAITSENEIEVEIAEGVKVRIVRSNIVQVLSKTEPAASK